MDPEDKEVLVLSVEQKRLVSNLRKSLSPEMHQQAEEANFGLDDFCLIRYLRAAKWKLSFRNRPLYKYIQDTIDWRNSMGIRQLNAQVLAEEIRKQYLYTEGVDKYNRPIIYVKLGFTKKVDSEMFIKTMVYTLERAISGMRNPEFGRISVLVDCENFNRSTAPSFGCIKDMLNILTHHYPKRLSVACVFNASKAVLLFWSIIRVVLKEKTKSKVFFLSGSDGDKESLVDTIFGRSYISNRFHGLNSSLFSRDKYILSDPLYKDQSETGISIDM